MPRNSVQFQKGLSDSSRATALIFRPWTHEAGRTLPIVSAVIITRSTLCTADAQGAIYISQGWVQNCMPIIPDPKSNLHAAAQSHRHRHGALSPTPLVRRSRINRLLLGGGFFRNSGWQKTVLTASSLVK